MFSTLRWKSIGGKNRGQNQPEKAEDRKDNFLTFAEARRAIFRAAPGLSGSSGYSARRTINSSICPAAHRGNKKLQPKRSGSNISRLATTLCNSKTNTQAPSYAERPISSWIILSLVGSALLGRGSRAGWGGGGWVEGRRKKSGSISSIPVCQKYGPLLPLVAPHSILFRFF